MGGQTSRPGELPMPHQLNDGRRPTGALRSAIRSAWHAFEEIGAGLGPVDGSG